MVTDELVADKLDLAAEVGHGRIAGNLVGGGVGSAKLSIGDRFYTMVARRS